MNIKHSIPTADQVISAVLAYTKIDRQNGVVTIIRPDFSCNHNIPGISPNASPDKVEIDSNAKCIRIWGIGATEPRVIEQEKPKKEKVLPIKPVEKPVIDKPVASDTFD